VLCTRTPKALAARAERVCSPAETLRGVLPFCARVGITRVANVTGMDTIGIPTFMVVRPNSRSLSVSQGKGPDPECARISGIMESIEQWHAERIALPLRLARVGELAPLARVADVAALPRYVSEFGPGSRILWIEGSDLQSSERVWIPYEMVHLDLTLPLPSDSGYFLPGSNGLASGNHVLEAVAHGLYEVVERDAVALFYRLSTASQWSRRVDPDSIDDATCRRLLELYAAAQVEVAVWDVTSDTQVPCYLCSILDRDPDPFRPVGLARGSGCHPDRGVALCRALTEAAQSRLTRIVGTRDDIQREDFEALQSPERMAASRRQMATPRRPSRLFPSTCSFATSTLEEDIAQTCERLRQVGIEQVLFVDLSKHDFPISVVRVVVPGLEGVADAPGYRPGRRAAAITAQEGA
jgi:YcaO-like protein with predicted kinase domain